MYLRYYDERFGDTYELYLDDQTHELLGISRSLEAIGKDVIHYDTLRDVPPVQRHAIEQLIQTELEKLAKDPTNGGR